MYRVKLSQQNEIGAYEELCMIVGTDFTTKNNKEGLYIDFNQLTKEQIKKIQQKELLILE